MFMGTLAVRLQFDVGQSFVTLLFLLLHLGFGSVCPQTEIWIIQQRLCVSTTEASHNCKASLAVFP